MADRVRTFDWSRTPLGSIDRWPLSLRTLVDLLLSQPMPMILLWGPDLTQIYNDGYAVIAGSKHPWALGQRNRDCWPEASALTDPIYERVLNRGERVLLYDQLIPLDRHGRGTLEDAYFTVSYSPARGDDGRIEGIFVTVVEVTAKVLEGRERERRVADEHLRRGHETFYNLIQNNPFGVYVVDADFRLAQVSLGARKVFEKVHPSIGRDFAEVLRSIWVEPFASEAIALFRRTLETGEPYAALRTVEQRRDIAEVEAYDWRIERITLPDGRFGVVCYFYDLSERRRTEAALRESEERLARQSRLFEQIASTTPDFIYVFGLDGRFIYANRRLLEVWGRSFDEAVGKSLIELGYPQWHADMHMRELRQVIETKQPIKGEVPFTGGSGISGVYEYIFTPVLGPGGEVEVIAGTTRDVTDRHRIAGALAQTQRRLDSALIAGEVGTFEWDVAADRLWGDRNFERIFGISLDASGAAPLADYVAAIHPDDRPAVMERVNRTVETGTPYRAEYRIRHGEEVRWVVARGTVERSDDGRVVLFAGVVLDITDRKRAEERLRTSEERLALALASGDLGTFYCPMPLGRIEWNDTCKAHFWLPPDAEIDFELFYAIIHPDDREHTRQAVDRAVYGREPYDVEYRTVAPDGRERWVRAKGRAYYDAAGNPVRFDGVTLDVTEPRRAVDALRESERRFREMADTAPAMLWVTQADGYCSFLSRGWYEFTGQTVEEGLGFGWTNAAHPDDRESARIAFVAATRDRTYYEIDFRIRRADGEYRWVIDAGRPRFGAGGEFLGFIGAVIDITDRKRAEEERNRLLDSERAARAEAERAGRMKDEFLATLSHELRTPLNAILGWSQILVNSEGGGRDLQEGLATIGRNARAQTQIIDDLLDMSRIISGKVRLDVQRVGLAEVVRAAMDTVRPAADAKGIRLQSVLDPLAGPVSGDPNRLQQVFWNLLNNAVKFTPRGGRVQVVLERVNSHVEVSVIDTGEGIRPEFLPHVFDRFRQADASTTRQHGGLGLGLAIVKQLVELHGGTVRAKSAGPGQGSTFSVALPLSVIQHGHDVDADRRHPLAPPQPAGALDVCVELRGVRVLVVDDEPDARALLRRLLEDCNAIVAHAGSAGEAYDCVLREPPDVLVSDIGMPGEDGYSLIRRIRALPADRGGNVPALALTAYARSEDRTRSVLAGFQMHMSKPVEPAELIAMVASLAGRTGSRTDTENGV